MNFQVNLNGSSAERLAELHLAVLHAAQALDAALGQACPHGRDYQTLPNGEGLRLDQDEWLAMRLAVAGIEAWAEAAVLRALTS